MDYTYFDFSGNWNAVYTIWKTPKIQGVLEKEMREWCLVNEIDREWKQGEPLWEFSTNEYWTEQAISKADSFIEEKRLLDTFIISMNRLGLRKSRCQMEALFYATCFDDLFQSFLPQDDTIESLIMVGGESFISPVLYEVARDMFPGQVVVMFTTDDGIEIVCLPELKMLFSMKSYYSWHHLHDESFRPDKYLFRKAPVLLEVDFRWNKLGMYHVVNQSNVYIDTSPEVQVWNSIKMFLELRSEPVVIVMPHYIIHDDLSTAFKKLDDILKYKNNVEFELDILGYSIIVKHGLLLSNIWVMTDIHSFTQV